MYQNTNIQNYEYYKNNEKIVKFNENIQNEIESKVLKKKVHFMKKTIIKNSCDMDILDILGEEENKASKLKKSEIRKKDELIPEKKNKKNKKNQKSFDKSLETNSEDKSPTKAREKYRKLKRTKEIFDSFDDEEYEEEN